MPSLSVEDFYKELGSLVKSERIKKEMSQEILADQLELTRASIINLEKGRHKPSIYQLILIAELLQVDFNDLIPAESKTKTTKKSALNELSNAVSDQEKIEKSAKNAVMDFLHSIKRQ